MTKRRVGFRDPTGESIIISGLTEEIQHLTAARQAALILYFIEGVSLREVARIAELPLDEVRQVVFSAVSMLRHPGRLSAYAGENGRGTSKQIHRMIEDLSMTMLRPCEKCGRVAVGPVARQGGRPGRYCSSPCRQAAYRSRKKAGASSPSDD